jgi:hypothetical protein
LGACLFMLPVLNEDSKYVDLAYYLLVPRRNNAAEIKSLCRYSCDIYALALEPLENRSKKVIMLTEAYAM